MAHPQQISLRCQPANLRTVHRSSLVLEVWSHGFWSIPKGSKRLFISHLSILKYCDLEEWWHVASSNTGATPCLSPVSDFDDTVLTLHFSSERISQHRSQRIPWRSLANQLGSPSTSIGNVTCGAVGKLVSLWKHKECIGILHVTKPVKMIPTKGYNIQDNTGPMHLVGHFHTGSSHFGGP